MAKARQEIMRERIRNFKVITLHGVGDETTQEPVVAFEIQNTTTVCAIKLPSLTIRA